MQASQLRGTPASFTGQQFIAMQQAAQHHRLHHAGLGNRLGQFLQAFAVEMGARLGAARANQVDGDLPHHVGRMPVNSLTQWFNSHVR